MKTTLHISNWSLQSFSTMERPVCGYAYNIIDVKQPRKYKPGE